MPFAEMAAAAELGDTFELAVVFELELFAAAARARLRVLYGHADAREDSWPIAA